MSLTSTKRYVSFCNFCPKRHVANCNIQFPNPTAKWEDHHPKMSLTCHSNCNYLCFSVFRPPLQHFKIARKVEKNRLKLAFQAVLLWLPKKDSNPHKQSQSLSCYPYTIRQYSRSKPVGFKRFIWLPKKDSNPHKQSQSLSCYPYTIRQYVFAVS